MSERLQPPRALAWLAARVLAWVADADALTALNDRFDDRARLHGRAAATIWYARQVAGFLVAVPAHHLASLAVNGWTGLPHIRSIGADLKYALRVLRQKPSSTALAIVALSLGIGLTTTMFSIAEGVLLRGLPFEEPDRLMFVGRVNRNRPMRPGATTPHDFADWRARQVSFESLAGYGLVQRVVTGGQAPNRYRGALVTANTFGALRIVPILGRDFVDADGVPGAPPVVILSHRIWRTQFEGDPSVLNQMVRVGGVPTTIVGVMPERFGFPEAQDFWQPLQIQLAAKRGEGSTIQVIGRLKTGVSRATAQTEFLTIARALSAEFRENENQSVQITPLIDHLMPFGTVTPLMAMLAAVGGVMLIACSNVTNLQLARAAERTRELAVRTFLGASRGRIVRQMLIEGLVLASVSAVIGLGVTSVAVDLFNRAIADTDPPFFVDVRIDFVVLTFVTILTGVAAIVSSLMPALRATRLDANGALKGNAGAGRSLRMSRFGRWLVVGEVLTSCILLIVSGMMIKSIVLSAQRTYPFATQDTLVASLTLDPRRQVADDDLARSYAQLEQQIAAVPGVRRVALSSGPPPVSFLDSVAIEGREESARMSPMVSRLAVSPAFFDVLRVQRLQGRLFTDADSARTERVAVVDDAFARRHFPDGDALGKQIRTPAHDRAAKFTVVGIVTTLNPPGGPEPARDSVFIPIAQAPTRSPTLLISTYGDPLALVRDVRRSVLAVDEDAAIAQPASLADYLARDNWRYRVSGGLFLSFGLAALVLAAAGLYGVMSFDVRRRTHEIGVRLALGATRASVVRLILGEGLWRVGVGMALGLLPAWGLATLLSSWIYSGVPPTDLTCYAIAVLLLGGTGLCASVIPARRAAAVDPVVSLRTT